MRYFLIIICFLSYSLHAQIRNIKTDSNTIKEQDTLVIDSGKKDSMQIFKPGIRDYKFKTQFGDYQIYDTDLTLQKSYEYTQYNNRDNFGKVQFANIGSGFQDLVFRVNPEQNLSLLPTNKSHIILGINDVKYYDVKTPTTSFIYHTAMQNGAALQSTYTQNFGKQLNIAVEYMGLRSQGFYQNSLAANNTTLFSGRYQSKNERYHAYAHYIHQNVNNQEYGGIAQLDLYLDGDSRFNNRQNLEVNLQNSDSRFAYRRYYFSHELTPFNSERFPFKIRHTIFHQGNKYYYQQNSAQAYYYDDPRTDLIEYDLNTKKYSKNLSNMVSLMFDKANFKFDAGVRYQNIKLGVDKGVSLTDLSVPSELSESRLGAVGNLKMNLVGWIGLDAALEYSNGKAFGNFIRSANQVKLTMFKDYQLNGRVNFQSATPSFNYLLNTSVYRRLNYNFTDAKNEIITEIGGDIGLKWFNSKAFANIYRVDNYAYFDSEGQPRQSSKSLNISQIGGEATFTYNKFNLYTKLLVQSALSGKELYPMPNIVARANLYWQSKAFKDAAEIQTGLKANYFSRFDSRDYLPVLNEFILADSGSYAIGGHPVLDAYFNLKVKTMLIYFEAQNFTSTFIQNKTFTAPYYPIYDFRLNIGIVWHLFH